MSTLADLPELVGFFSYSREDDEAFQGSLSALRDGIQRDSETQTGDIPMVVKRGVPAAQPARLAPALSAEREAGVR